MRQHSSQTATPGHQFVLFMTKYQILDRLIRHHTAHAFGAQPQIVLIRVRLSAANASRLSKKSSSTDSLCRRSRLGLNVFQSQTGSSIFRPMNHRKSRTNSSFPSVHVQCECCTTLEATGSDADSNTGQQRCCPSNPGAHRPSHCSRFPPPC